MLKLALKIGALTSCVLAGLSFVDLVLRAFTVSPYEKAADFARVLRLDGVFAGSSRVAAAVMPAEFDHAVQREGLPRTFSYCTAHGYTTLAVHALGLRELLGRLPRDRPPPTVFIEAPEGFPAHEGPDDPWCEESAPELLAAVMRPGDLPRFWRQAGGTLDARVEVTAGTLVPLLARWPRERARMRADLAAIVRSAAGLEPAPAADLASVGGILTDLDRVARARRLAARVADARIAAQVPWRDWDRTWLAEVVSFVRGRGGRVVLFRIPVPPVLRREYGTALRRADRPELERTLARWGVPVLDPRMATGEDDFPDGWHLRASRASEFSIGLAHAYAEWVRAGSR